MADIPLACSQFISPKECAFYYPFGNSLPEDILLYHPRASNLLFLGCGDLRNLFFSLYESHRRKIYINRSIVMNDWKLEVIARNSMIIYALIYKKPSIEDIAQIWYSCELSPQCYTYWIGVMKECISFDWGTSVISFSDLDRVRFVWQRWIDFKWPKALFLQKRMDIVSKKVPCFKSLVQGFLIKHFDIDAKKDIRRERELEIIAESGSLYSENDSLANPTFVCVDEDSSFSYALHYGNSLSFLQ
jgi:hypothetical protein